MRAIETIVATYNARSTVERAIRSALAQPQVSRVIVTDDASTDGTPDLVEQLFAGDPRVMVLRATANAGPAKARNVAIDRVEADYFAILDSDDFFLPGRFDALAGEDGFDIWADNILFTNDAAAVPVDAPRARGDATVTLDTAAFVAKNLNNFWQRRRQLGFVKPVFRTAFLRDRGIRYDERLRLGEDFVLLVDLLEAGARFRLTRDCGYVAIERADSLSALHGLDDLANLLAAEARLRDDLSARRGTGRVFEKRYRQTRTKFNYSTALGQRRERGLAGGVSALAALPPGEAGAVAAAVLADKLRTILKGRRHGGNGPFAYYLM